MTGPKHFVLDLDVQRQMNSFDEMLRKSNVLEDMHNLSNTAARIQTLLAESGVSAEAQRFFQQGSIASSIANQMQELNIYNDIQQFPRPDAGILAAVAAAEAANQRQSLAVIMATNLDSAQEFSRNLAHYRDIARIAEANFHLPSTSESVRLLASLQLEVGTVADYARQYIVDMVPAQELFASLTAPWVREVEAARSATALLELQGLGAALRSSHGFDDVLTSALRADFGDWRDHISFSPIICGDPVARSKFYIDRGFNASLTDFPDEAFREGLALVGLDDGSAVFFEKQLARGGSDSVEEAALWRTNKCHDYLQRLERKLRQFINSVMTEQYGVDWPKRKLSPQMLESWEHKKSRAERGGAIITVLIEAADFTEYETIICRKDHWREVFQYWFQRPESIRESFQRLYPIRLATMHSRFVTKEDELYLLAESTRLINAINKGRAR
jgi:hypothetical protein